MSDHDTNVEARLMCQANGCPNRWAVDAGGGRLCSAHQWASRPLWPQVTQEQQDAETDRAFRNANRPTEPVEHPRRDPARLAAALAKLAQQKDSLAWAKRLRWCEEKRAGRLPNGTPMTEFQRQAWRQALGRQPEPEIDEQPAMFPATNTTREFA